MQELVDILVTTYNTNEKYLRRQIETILKQTHKNIKIYISDDKSPNENIAQILKEYEQKDKRIKLFIQPENLGYNKNFEFLLKQSTADYIMFSDHDDIWHLDKVEKSLKKIKEENVDMVYCNCRLVNEDGVVIKENYFKYKNMPLIKKKNKLAISRCAGLGCTQIITKSVKEKMLPFKEEVMAHDWLAAFIANEGKGISYIKEPLIDYRLHTTNVFGGRSLSQNITKWKKENGKGYKSFVNYRKDVIKKAYADGITMCKQYATNEENKKFIEKADKYYRTIIGSKPVYLNVGKYFKILGGKNQGKKTIRELVLFHFPLLAYIKFAMTRVPNETEISKTVQQDGIEKREEKKMGFIKTLWKNKRIALKLGKSDFKNRFASTSLGSIWGFLQPFVFMMMYVIVFQFIFGMQGDGGSPYVVWFLPGMAVWQCLNDSIMSASSSIRNYSFLVKKVVFPVDIIPIISLIGSSFVSIFLLIVATVVCALFGYTPNILIILYVVVALYAFVVAFTRLTSALTTLVPDFSNLLGILMQLFFWATPVVWSVTRLAEHPTILKVVQCMPFSYLVTAFRQAFMGGNIVTESNGIYTIIFWIITIFMFVWGNHVFKKNKKDFSDVL